VAEELLDGANIVVIFQEMGRKAVAEGMRADRLGDTGLLGGLADGLLQAALIQVVAAHDAAARVHG